MYELEVEFEKWLENYVKIMGFSFLAALGAYALFKAYQFIRNMMEGRG